MLMIRQIALLSATTFLVACGGGGGGSDVTGPPGQVSACSATGQKQFVLDAMRDWYLWNDRLPASVDIGAYSTPEDLLAFLATFSPDLTGSGPVDRFSSINSAAADSAFFGEGKFEGFGFSSRFFGADDWRLTQVYEGSPAAAAGFARGQRILALNGRSIADIEAAEGINAVLDAPPVEFSLRRPDATEYSVTVDTAVVTIDPVPQWRILPLTGTPGVGYIELRTFISTADPKLDTVFGEFQASGVTDLIIDLRYNGGGLVSTAELLGDYLGGAVAQNLLFSETRFNADRAAEYNNSEFFELLGNSLGLSRLYIIATRNTASASELVTNSLGPHVEVVIVGDRTLGKPVGQVGLEFCDRILRPTSFQTVNANGEGDYFDGLPVQCPAADDLRFPIGADSDPNVIAALTHAQTGACPVSGPVAGVAKPALDPGNRKRAGRGNAAREYANAW